MAFELFAMLTLCCRNNITPINAWRQGIQQADPLKNVFFLYLSMIGTKIDILDKRVSEHRLSAIIVSILACEKPTAQNVLPFFQMSCKSSDELQNYKSRGNGTGNSWTYCRNFENRVKKVKSIDGHNLLTRSSFARRALALSTEEKRMSWKAYRFSDSI